MVVAAEVEGAKDVADLLRTFARKFPSRLNTKGLRAVAKESKNQHLVRLRDTKTEPDGSPWAPWSEAYAKTRSGRHSLLQDTKTMSRGLKVVKAGPDLMMGSPLDRAKFHQDGTKRMKARPIFGVGDRDVPALQQVLDDWVFGEARSLGVS